MSAQQSSVGCFFSFFHPKESFDWILQQSGSGQATGMFQRHLANLPSKHTAAPEAPNPGQKVSLIAQTSHHQTQR